MSNNAAYSIHSSIYSLLLSLIIGLMLLKLCMLINNYSYNNLSNKGVRIALRSKVDSALITGIAIIDAIIPIGRGQRQLILGNRYTGKTYIIITTIISNAPQNLLASNYSIGTRRLFSIYIAINHNLSKMSKIISLLVKIE